MGRAQAIEKLILELIAESGATREDATLQIMEVTDNETDAQVITRTNS